MTSELEQAYARLQAWAERARQAGWLSEADIHRLQRMERQDADELFAAGTPRPLLVGLFGGTGVGKSSLLNRLAGEDIARVGVQRPTSREVTLYLHQDHAVESLPSAFPVASTQVRYHHDDRRRDVAWIDMPDIDSTERSNRELVFAWLPYIDWLIYVVSPERYRDDAGWQILRERGHRHEWLFVMNQWDTADAQQHQAFVADLARAGIEDPRVLRTSCTADHEQDEFPQLEAYISDAIERHGLEELKRLGMLAKLEELEQLRVAFADRLGTEDAWQAVRGRIPERAGSVLARLRESLAWPFTMISGRIPESRRREKGSGGEILGSDDELRGLIWGPQADNFASDLVNEAVLAADENDVPTAPVEQAATAVAEQLPGFVTQAALAQLRQALASPGPAWQRGLCRLLGTLRMALPAAAAAWAGYHVISRFHAGTLGEADFLGLDFAVHSALLIGGAWLLPYLLHRLLEPSPRKAARSGLARGAEAGTRRSEQELAATLERLDAQRSELLRDLRG